MLDQPMMERTAWRRTMAAELFNFVWTLLEKADRSEAEVDAMIHAAHASVHHWGEVGTPLNKARGEWQVSRVYATIGRPEPALFHAERCLKVTLENRFGDFDLAYAYEAMARAHGLAGNSAEAQRFRAEAEAAGRAIAEEDDRKLFDQDLASLP